MKPPPVFTAILAIVTVWSCLSAVGRGQDKGISVVRVVKVATPGGATFLYRESHALLMGNAYYQDRAWDDLERIPAELEELRAQLEAQGFVIYRGKVHLDLTKKQMLELVEDFVTDHGVGKKVADDRLLMFYSGHGESEGDNGFLVPVDAPGSGDWDAFRKAAVEMVRVEGWAKRIEAKHAMFGFDSCFSGMVFARRGEREVPPHVTMKAAKPVREFITAGGKDQTVPAISVFTPYFTRGIAGEADAGDKDGYVTFGELAQFVTAKVARAVGNDVQDGELPHPFDQGEMVFSAPLAPRHQVGDVSIMEIAPGVKVRFIYCEPGKFIMGEGTEAHELTLTQGFWLAETETTQGQWEAVMKKNPSHFKGEENPVEDVGWEVVEEFIAKIGGGFRLPTKAEWEYACRAGSTTTWCFGDDEARLGDYAWFEDNSDKRTHPVGLKKPNAWGIYDMHGNVLELCQDSYAGSPGPDVWASRVSRGGSWASTADDARSAVYRDRGRDPPAIWHGSLGFRLARSSTIPGP